MKKFLAALLSVTLFLGTGTPVLADDGQMQHLTTLVESLQKQMMNMQQTIASQNLKIQGLQSEMKSSKGPTLHPVSSELGLPAENAWLKGLKFSSQLRLRYEGQHHSTGDPTGLDDRNRFRFRLLYGFDKTFSDEMKVGFHLTSGNTTDPTSRNQTLGGNFTYKAVQIERAYARYKPEWAVRGPISQLEVALGKTKNPFLQGSSEIIWDTDVRPEGGFQQTDFDLFSGERFNLSGYFLTGAFVLTESGGTTGDAELFAYQLGLSSSIDVGFMEKPLKLKSVVSHYSYNDFAEGGNFGALGRTNPNVDPNPTELDVKDFEIIESYSELSFQPDGWMPIKAFFDVATNLADGAPDASLGGEHLAWAIGAKIGKSKQKKDWWLGYEYRWIDPNAVPSAFNDADFGGADRRGSVVKLGYLLTDNLTLSSSMYFTNFVSAGTIGRDEGKQIYQLNLIWKY